MNWLVTLCLLLMLSKSWSAPFPGSIKTVRSRTDQFVIHQWRSMAPSGMLKEDSLPETFLTLDPSLLSVSCERIKSTLLRTLQLNDDWKGKIHVRVNPLAQPNSHIVLTSTRFLDGWRYHLEIPEVVDRDKLIRAVTQCLVLEIANRSFPGQNAAEIPLWFSEGLSIHLKMHSVSGLVLDRNHPVLIRVTQPDPLKEAREHFLTHSPLGINELSFPQFENASTDWVTFQHTAHLLVHFLLDQPSQQGSMVKFIKRLPHYENWQLGLLDAYSSRFESMRDLEKWWVLVTDQFQNSNRWQQLSFADSLLKLRQVLTLSARMRPEESAESSVIHTNLTLANLLSQWPEEQQVAVLQEKLKELTALQPNLNPHVYPLLQSYLQAIQDYLLRLQKVGKDPVEKGQQPLRRDWVEREFHNRMANLDQQWRMQRQAGAPPP